MPVHINILISGKVQKIGFRYSALQVADKMNICGFVQNLPDGKVFIEAEGDEANIENFIEWCHSGPKWAIVDFVQVEKSEMKNYSFFEIKAS